ncbi:MAG: glycosyltransferase family 4 protein [Oscillospiraceae bacterium]|nr:glycosyltransferase family 4 protein [Oscillospiraceae bacterium]
MKVLMLVNWKVKYCDQIPADKQPPDYYVQGAPYWFFRYFKEQPEVDVVDIRSFPWLEKFEKNKIRFYIWQTLRVLPKLHKYDLIISHGAQSGVVLSLWRRLFKTKAKHVLFDIGSFNSAAESGFALKLMQFASKSLDGVIYHTSSQLGYYEKFFPWIVEKSKFLRFGTDLEFFDPTQLQKTEDSGKYILCVGYSKRDWATLVQAYRQLNTDVKLRLAGKVDPAYEKTPGVEQVPFVPIKELIQQIFNARFCVLPLEWFNYSYGQMTLMQQMALGKCVVTAKVPSLTDYVEDGKTAVFYEPKNAEELAQKLQILLADSDLCEKIATAGKEHLAENCNEQIMAEEIERAVQSFL